MKHIENFEGMNEEFKVPLPTLTAQEVEAIENILDGLAGVLSEGRITPDNYWTNINKDVKTVLEIIKRCDPSEYKKLKAYYDGI